MVSWAWVEQTNRQVKSQMLCFFQVNTRDLKQNGTMWKDGKGLTKIMKIIEVDSENLEEALDKGVLKEWKGSHQTVESIQRG
ncbi:hypothetical protein TNCV_2750171 [Trichonephila clavipes]|nr:hypothetical protein TNCV_2750171 [Trichonephila clavipes]